MRDRVAVLLNDTQKVMDLEGFDLLLAETVQNEMTAGNHNAARLSLAALNVVAEEAPSTLGINLDMLNRLRDRLWSMAAFAHYRMGDSDDQRRYVAAMRRLNEDVKDDHLTAKILSHEHYQCLTSESALKAIELIESKSVKEANAFGISRVRVFASEVIIHRGGDIGSRIKGSGRLTVERAIAEAYQAECERSDFDSAMRFQTVPIRAAVWNNRIIDAIDTANAVAAELDRHENALGKPLLHVRMRIAIDRAAAWYVEGERSQEPSAEAEWRGQLARALSIAKTLEIPLLTEAHAAEYGKLVPPLPDAVEFQEEKN